MTELLFKHVINIFICYLKGCVQGYGNYEELTASGIDPKVGLVTIYISKLVWKSFLIISNQDYKQLYDYKQS